MTIRQLPVLAVVLGALGGWHVAAAHAQDDAADREAESLFEAGRTAYDAGHYQDAMSHFQSAYDLSHRPQMLFNIGQCADRLRLDDAAIDTFERYLAAVPGAENRVEVETRLRALHAAQDRRAHAPPTPAQVAHDATPPASALTAQDRRAPETSIVASPWLWIGVGAVVVAVLIIAITVAASHTEAQPAIPGDIGAGGIVSALAP